MIILSITRLFDSVSDFPTAGWIKINETAGNGNRPCAGGFYIVSLSAYAASDKLVVVAVEIAELCESAITGLSLLFGSFEELLGALGHRTGESAVTGLCEDEVGVRCGRFLGVEREGLLVCRVEAEVDPVAGFDSLLGLSHAVDHTALDTVVNARCVGDDERRTMICFGFKQCLDALVEVGTHSDLSNIYVAVRHSDGSKILLAGGLTSRSELSDRAGRSCLRSLTAGVGVNLGVEYQDVDILAGSDDMVKTAEADVVCPSVAAEDPYRLLYKEILHSESLFVESVELAAAGAALFDSLVEGSFKRSGSNLGLLGVVFGIEPLSCRAVDGCVIGIGKLRNDLSKSLTTLTVCDCHTEAVLGVVFEQGVCPSRTLAPAVGGVRSRRSRTAPNRGAAGRVGDNHAVAEELGDESCVRSLAAAGACARELKQRLLELAALDGGGLELGKNIGIVRILVCKLAELQPARSLDASINPYGGLIYKVDYDVGFKVKIVSKKWGVSMDSRITEIEETYDTDGLTLDVTFGKGLLTLSQKLKQV